VLLATISRVFLVGSHGQKLPKGDSPNHTAGKCSTNGMRKGNSSKSLLLVVSTHPKNISQDGNLPQIGVKIENI